MLGNENLERKAAFIRTLAEFLVENQAMLSIKLQAGTSEGKAWAKLRQATPLFGYPTVDQATATLTEFLR